MVIARVQILSIYLMAVVNKLLPIHTENMSVRFYVSYDKSNCFKSVIYPSNTHE